MNVRNEWDRWAEIWQQQPSMDMDRLRLRIRRKLWRMRVIVALELLVSAIAVVQVIRLMGFPGIEWRWKLWAAMTMAFLLIMQGLFLRARRGAWQARGDGPADALRLMARRAVAGIRLAKVNIWGIVLWTAVTLLVAAPELAPTRWQHDPQLKWLIVLQCAVNLPIIVAVLGLCAWYIRRQRRRLRQAEVLLRGYED